MRFITVRVSLAVIAALFLVATVDARKWTSADGKFSVDAEFVSATEANVIVRRADGREITVPRARLSAADQAFVVEQLKNAATVDDGPVAVQGDSAKAKETLEGKGLKVLPSGLKLAEEEKLSAGLKGITKARTDMTKSAQQLALLEQQADANRKNITGLIALNVQLNARLTMVADNDVSTNNKLVGAIQANESQVDLLNQANEKLVEQIRTARGSANETREAYVGQILELRKLADSVSSSYTKLATDADVRAAIASLNAATGKTYTATPSRDFLSSERKLVQLEDTVLSESIPLRRNGGGDSLWVPVVINGKHTKEMVVDSGSSMICMPRAIAKECGIEVGSQHQEITLVLADGSRIQAHEVPLDSVRVGKFTVENVVCAVLGPEATEAEALLGMSFLGQFKWELDSETATLKMVKVETGKTRGN